MPMIVQELALELIVQLRPLVPAIKRHDASLAKQLQRCASSMVLNIAEGAKQLQRCASSMVLNIAEGEYSDPGTKRARFHSAAGSAGETRAALRVAAAWQYLAEAQVEPSLARLDRVLGMLWTLTH